MASVDQKLDVEDAKQLYYKYILHDYMKTLVTTYCKTSPVPVPHCRDKFLPTLIKIEHVFQSPRLIQYLKEFQESKLFDLPADHIALETDTSCYFLRQMELTRVWKSCTLQYKQGVWWRLKGCVTLASIFWSVSDHIWTLIDRSFRVIGEIKPPIEVGKLLEMPIVKELLIAIRSEDGKKTQTFIIDLLSVHRTLVEEVLNVNPRIDPGVKTKLSWVLKIICALLTMSPEIWGNLAEKATVELPELKSIQSIVKEKSEKFNGDESTSEVPLTDEELKHFGSTADSLIKRMNQDGAMSLVGKFTSMLPAPIAFLASKVLPTSLPSQPDGQKPSQPIVEEREELKEEEEDNNDASLMSHYSDSMYSE